MTLPRRAPGLSNSARTFGPRGVRISMTSSAWTHPWEGSVIAATKRSPRKAVGPFIQPPRSSHDLIDEFRLATPQPLQILQEDVDHGILVALCLTRGVRRD